MGCGAGSVGGMGADTAVSGLRLGTAVMQPVANKASASQRIKIIIRFIA
jgi:hypothetical protein